MKRNRRHSKNILLVLLLIVLIISTITIYKFNAEHYRAGTKISGIDCSFLTVSKAEKKINSKLLEQSFSFVFSNETLILEAQAINLKLSNTDELKEILLKQNNRDKTKIYELENSFCFDINMLQSFLSDINSLKPENMYPAQNAYLNLTDLNFLEIVAEKQGFQITYEDAYLIAYSAINKGETVIDFTEIGIIYPEINSTDSSLLSQKDTINQFLSTIINFTLSDGTIVTLNNNITKNWLVIDENGNYNIDIDSNLPNFVTYLSDKVNESSSFIEFNATNVGEITVPVPKRNRFSLDIEKETNLIKTLLYSGIITNCEPLYLNDISFTSYVEIDISRQTVWMYYNGECILETPCVTGTVSNGRYDTPPGLFYLTYKIEDDYLEGYNADGSRYKAFVNYWMPFNGDIGMHDLKSRKKFGGEIYKTNGSHGCINLPLEAAKTIYEHIDNSMPIIVYESNQNS